MGLTDFVGIIKNNCFSVFAEHQMFHKHINKPVEKFNVSILL